MRKTLLTLILLNGLFYLGCQSNSSDAESNQKDSPAVSEKLSFEASNFTKQFGSCVDTAVTGNCVNIKFNFPKAIGKHSTFINDAVETSLKGTLQFVADSLMNQLSLEQLADSVIADYRRIKSEYDDTFTEYHFEVDAKVLWHTDQLVTIELPAYTYTGGAHPNSYVQLLNLDLGKEQVLHSEDIIADTTALKELGEVAFFEKRQDVESKDEFFWGSGYYLPANLALTEKGLYFYYNPYEAAAYVYGPTDYTLPYEKLTKILHPQFLPKGK